MMILHRHFANWFNVVPYCLVFETDMGEHRRIA